MSLPLAGRTIVVTRPAAQAGPLAEAIAAAGGRPLVYPLLTILPAEDQAPLRELAGRLADFALIVFISPNAVDHGLPSLLAGAGWPAGVVPAAVGQGTVRTLAAHGVTDCRAPTERFDSEALLALPELSAEAVAGRGVLIVRGDGGRELLADTLQARGAHVECVTAYRRRGPAAGAAPLLGAWRAGQLDAITVSSSEGLRYLLAELDAEGLAFLRATPVFVPHARIGETARAAGLTHIVACGAGDAGIVTALCDYNWHK